MNTINTINTINRNQFQSVPSYLLDSLLENDLGFYTVLIGSGIILTFTLYNYIKKNNIAIPSKNMESITNQEVETISNENAISNENINKFITDSESDSGVESDHQSRFDFDSNSDSSSDFGSILNDRNLSFVPNVDFDICPIEELKLFEFNSLYAREIMEHAITDEEIMEFLDAFTKEELATN